MEYALSDDLKLLRQTVRSFVQRELAPVASALDEEERVPFEVLRKAADLGLLGIPFAEEYGGMEAGITGYCVLMEEVNRACSATGTILGAHMALCSSSIALAGTPEQKERYLRPLIEGRSWGAWALTEPGAGSDAARLATTAVRQGDEYVLNGSKMWITNGPFADVLVVFASTEPAAGPRGISAFIVEKSFPGFKVGKVEPKMGLRGSHTSSLFFEDCRVPAANLLGEAGKGYGLAMQTLDLGRCGLGAASLGAAREAFELARRYVTERQQFGRPLADFQALQFKLADMAVKLYAMQQMVYDTAARVDRGESVRVESSIVKLFCTDSVSQIIDEAIQIHGGMGFSRELPLERMYRDTRVFRIYEGTNEIQRYVIASELLKEVGHRVRM